MKENEQIRKGLAIAAQAMMALTDDNDGIPYYTGPIDGAWEDSSRAAAVRMLRDLEPKEGPEQPTAADGIMGFFLSEDGEKKVSEHFKVREFACKDGSNPVFIHRRIPSACEMARTINGPFSPNSAYRTPQHNKSVDGASASQHMLGIAVDIPSVKATPEELYQLMEGWLEGRGGLGIYSWGIHVDFREVPARWDER